MTIPRATGATHPPPDGGALTILGLESSCDDTAAAVVRLHSDGRPEVLAERVAGQDAAHAPYGGVVPEIAARAHVEALDGLMRAVMAEAGVRYSQLDAVAATAGPGLIGGVMAGLTTAKAVCIAHDLPLIAVNHLEGHALSPRLAGPVSFPFLLLLVSGGHTQLVLVEDIGACRRLGSTLDDAAGEAFDKTAKVLGLGHPGGPALERLAEGGDPARFALPRPLTGTPGCDFSFAGLKTAAARVAQDLTPEDAAGRAALAASFQAAVADALADRTRNALDMVAAHAPTCLVVAGGVAANRTVHARLNAVAEEAGLALNAPPLKWCTDNAAMIALAGAERARRGWFDPLDVAARPRWPLDEARAAADPVVGSGRKGPKA